MSWFTRGPGKRSSPSSSQSATAEAELPVHRSLALAALLAEMRRGRKPQVLDLGSAVGSNVEYLSRFECKLYIEDLYSALSSKSGDGDADQRFFAEFLPLPEGTRIDVVLAWDLFNYLKRKELGKLIEHLAPFCRPGALLFTLISTQKEIPAQPIRFKIVDEDKLLYEVRTSSTRPSPRYAPAEVRDLLRGFRVDRSFLLRHGIQEYLFVREGAAEA